MADCIEHQELVLQLLKMWKNGMKTNRSTSQSKEFRRRKNHMGTWTNHWNKDQTTMKLCYYWVSHQVEELSTSIFDMGRWVLHTYASKRWGQHLYEGWSMLSPICWEHSPYSVAHYLLCCGVLHILHVGMGLLVVMVHLCLLYIGGKYLILIIIVSCLVLCT